MGMEAAKLMTTAACEERIELWETKEKKRLLIAAHERLELTGFIMRNALSAVREAMDRAESIVLSER